jgi:uncharacterized DUF497 family protein
MARPCVFKSSSGWLGRPVPQLPSARIKGVMPTWRGGIRAGGPRCQTPVPFSLATERSEWYNSHIRMRFSFDSRKSRRLRANPRRGIGFEEARELFSKPYWLDRRSDVPEQFLAVGWVGDRLYSAIFEVEEDEEGEILHLVTLWRSTKEEIRLYEENS